MRLALLPALLAAVRHRYCQVLTRLLVLQVTQEMHRSLHSEKLPKRMK